MGTWAHRGVACQHNRPERPIPCGPLTYPPPMTHKIASHYGRPNHHMAKVVHDALRLFRHQQPEAAIALLKKHDIPLPVVERVILRRGPRRRSLAA